MDIDKNLYMKQIIYFFLFFYSGLLFSQEIEQNKASDSLLIEISKKKDLKVGLVLSGGGAKGLAHVAVLKVLEEAGVRIDYIGGTSMGAIIGGLYASGYNANQLDSIIKTINFQKIIADIIPRKSKPFYEKESGEKYSITLPIKNKKIGIPIALSEGQSVLNVLTELTQNVNNISDFNKLPIPFLCIATNLETGKQELLNNGFLPLAMRASGSFPTLLAPVEINGKLLTDGGVVNNFPVEEVKAMGADIIIGVDIQGGLNSKLELNSAIKILNQIVGFQMYKYVDQKDKNIDLLIKPNMKNFNVVSFDKVTEILKQGDSAARGQIEKLQLIAQNQIIKKSHRFEVPKFQRFYVKKIEVEGEDNYTQAYILGKLNIRNNEAICYSKLLEGVNNLSATGNFENVQYRIINETDGSILKIRVKESSISNVLQFSAHFDDLYKTGILINVTSKHLLNKNDILSADLILGDNVRYNLNYFIDNGFYTSFGIKSSYTTFNASVNFESENVNKISTFYEDFSNQIIIQSVFNRKFAIGTGIEQKKIKVLTETVSDFPNNGSLYFDNSNYFNVIGFIKIDTYDKKYFQKSGLYLDAGFRWYLASTDYNRNFSPFSQLKGEIGIAYTFYDKLTTHFISEAGVTFGNNDNRVLKFNVGGYGENFINTLNQFYGYDFAELTGSGFLRSALTLRYEVFPKNYFSLAANYARVEDDIFNGGNLFENTKSGYKVGYGIDTFLGPIEINYTWSPDHNNNYLYFNVGYWF